MVLLLDIDTESGHHVLMEVLVLVVAPDQDHVRVETVEHLAGPPEAIHELLPMRVRRLEPLVVAPLGLHSCRPIPRVPQLRGRLGTSEVTPQKVRHLVFRVQHIRSVRHTQAKDLAHGASYFYYRSPPFHGRSHTLRAYYNATGRGSIHPFSHSHM